MSGSESKETTLIPQTMTVARLHGIRDLRVEHVPVPVPGPGELLIKVEACGLCPTDARKFDIGVNHGTYPFNPGHEWVGRVVRASGEESMVGLRVYGDTYGGYAEYATIPAQAGDSSFGALALDEDLAIDRAIFVEPLADCLHAVHDRAEVRAGQTVAVVGAGSMGLQLIAAAALAGASVIAIETHEDRRERALTFGAEVALAGEDWVARAREHADGSVDAVILSVGQGALVDPAVRCVRDGGRIVLFAGFGNEPRSDVDLNQLHYREVSITGSEWIGVPPDVRLERYEQARDLLLAGRVPVDTLITARCGFDGLEAALRQVRDQRQLKVILVPQDGS
jgi:L-iditol 2-dehydrogenase